MGLEPTTTRLKAGRSSDWANSVTSSSCENTRKIIIKILNYVSIPTYNISENMAGSVPPGPVATHSTHYLLAIVRCGRSNTNLLMLHTIGVCVPLRHNTSGLFRSIVPYICCWCMLSHKYISTDVGGMKNGTSFTRTSIDNQVSYVGVGTPIYSQSFGAEVWIFGLVSVVVCM